MPSPFRIFPPRRIGAAALKMTVPVGSANTMPGNQ